MITMMKGMADLAPGKCMAAAMCGMTADVPVGDAGATLKVVMSCKGDPTWKSATKLGATALAVATAFLLQ